ncbi:hypothetical protein EJ08DRAFT_467796 [Tothia fuscella]|uniref:Uncharacterized protein n=1 Tax=Tothia fuscella TaxID=1048955 RepID=A0A9P4P085_9PEZI|nr:hypothetical protein EJ08DRAFT_467796 [Tothia fuscella]
MGDQKSPKIRLFTGAPRSVNLKYGKTDLVETLLPAVDRFMNFDRQSGPFNITNDAPVQSSNNWPEWRVVSMQESHVQTSALNHSTEEEKPVELSPSMYPTKESAVQQNLLTPRLESVEDVRSSDADEDLQESFAMYNQVVLPPVEVKDDEASFLTRPTADFSLLSNMSFNSVESTILLPAAVSIPPPSGICDLKKLPNADYVERKFPLTITVNLIVGIISVTAPRAIHIKKGNYWMEIVELLVGDETRPGFKIDFWLSSASQTIDDPVRKTLQALRARDIVLLHNVAVHQYRSVVQGKSLPKSSMNKTKVDLLGRDGEIDLVDPTAKMKKVSDWVFAFLGLSKTSTKPTMQHTTVTDRYKSFAHFQGMELPPDTQ